jgi:hypothetical protein
MTGRALPERPSRSLAEIDAGRIEVPDEASPWSCRPGGRRRATSPARLILVASDGESESGPPILRWKRSQRNSSAWDWFALRRNGAKTAKLAEVPRPSGDIRGPPDRRLASEAHGESCYRHHRQVVRSVTHGDRARSGNAQSAAWPQESVGLRSWGVNDGSTSPPGGVGKPSTT